MSLFFVVLCILLMVVPKAARACTTVVVGKNASSTGTVLVAHNEDNPGRLFCSHDYVPPRHGFIAPVQYEDGAALLPPPHRALGFYWAGVREEAGHSSSDRFVNDRGVLLVTNNCRESRRDKPFDISEGGVHYALRRTVAEGAKSAYHGLLLATALLNRYGYRDSGRTYTIADAREAWILQVVAGRAWAAVKVDDDEVVLLPNHYTLRAGDLRRPHLLSPGLIETAVARGWHAPCDEEEFDFAAAYQDPESWRVPANLYRHIHLARALGVNLNEESNLPFAVRPRWAVTPKLLWAMLSDHYEGTEHGEAMPFGDGTPHQSPMRRICTETTHDSTVYVTNELAGKFMIQQCPGRPCTWPHFTFSLAEAREGIPPTLTPVGGDLHGAIDDHCRRKPQLLDDGPACHTLWDWATALNLRWRELTPAHAAWKEETQQAMEGLSLQEQDRVFARRARAFFEGPAAAAELRAGRNELFKEGSRRVPVSFSCPLELEESTVRMGQSGVMPHRWAAPIEGSLTCADGTVTAAFEERALTGPAKACTAHFFLTGRKSDGTWFVGKVRFKVNDRRPDPLIGV